MKKKKYKSYPVYTSAKMENNIVYVLERDIDVRAKKIIRDFEIDLKRRNVGFTKKKFGKYYRYWVIFNFFL